MTKGAMRRVAAGASLLAAVAFGFEATRSAWSDSIVVESNATMESAAWKKSAPGLEDWLRVRADLQEAQRLAPASPAAFESLGVLHARRAASREFLTYARDDFIRSLALRPTSPYTWANLAETKYLLGETGPAFEHALVRAAETGPWEPEVQRVIGDIGLAVFNEVSPRARTNIAAVVAFGMRRNPLEMLQIAQKRGRLDVACPHVAGNRRVTDPKWQQLCMKGKTT